MPDNAETQTPNAQDATAHAGETPAPTFSAEYVEKLRGENAKWRTALREKEAELTAAKSAPAVTPDELKALKAEIDQLKQAQAQRDAELKAKDAALLRHRIGTELGLTPKLADLLRGEDEDSIRAHAQELAAELPKPAASGRVSPGVTAGVPNGQPQGTTREQYYDRLYGRKRNTSGSPGIEAGGEVPKILRRGG